MITTTDVKICSRCRRELPLEKFSKQSKATDGLQHTCKDCYKSYCSTNASKIRKTVRHYREKNKNLIKSRIRARRFADPIRFLVNNARSRAKQKNLPFDNITPADIKIPDLCPVLGIKLRINEGQSGPDSPSLDRIDPSLGYVKGNVRIISHRANQLKNDASLHEAELIYLDAIKQRLTLPLPDIERDRLVQVLKALGYSEKKQTFKVIPINSSTSNI